MLITNKESGARGGDFPNGEPGSILVGHMGYGVLEPVGVDK